MTPDASDAPRAHHTPQLDQLRKQAKKLLQAARDNDVAAIGQLCSTVPRLGGIAAAEIPEIAQLADAQHAVARHAGHESWPKMKAHLELAEPLHYFLKKFRDAILAHDETTARTIFSKHYDTPDFYAHHTRFLTLARAGDGAAALQMATAHPEVREATVTVACCEGNSEALAQWLDYRKQRQLNMTGSAEATENAGAEALSVRTNENILLFPCASPFFKDSPERASGILRCVELLLETGADPNSYILTEGDEPNSKITALYHASVMGNTAVMRLLLEHGANPNDGESVPHAAEMNKRESLAVLLEYGAELSSRLPVLNDTTLHFLATQLWDKSRYENIMGGMRWLLEHGADPNVTTHPGLETPLHAAAQTARGADAVALLLQYGADFTAPRADGRRALNIAVRNGHTEIIELLNRPGAGVSHIDRLLGAAMRGANEEAIEILRERPNIITEFTDADRGMLANAVFLGSTNSLRVMAKLGFNLAWENDWGGTALHLAAWFGKVEMVRELIALGAPINVRDSRYGSSPVAWAGHGSTHSHSADEDYSAVIQLLIEAGSTQEAAMNKWNEKPSSMASTRVAKLLRQHGF